MKLGTSAVLLCIIMLMATPAYAYVDPGTGSMLIQFVTGGVAGALVLARLYWRRLKDRVSGRRPGADPTPSVEPDPARPNDRT
jgi:hypothetical protein